MIKPVIKSNIHPTTGMVKVFSRDAKGNVGGGSLISKEAAETFEKDIAEDNIFMDEMRGIPEDVARRVAFQNPVKYVFLGPESTIIDAKIQFSKIR